MVSGDNGVGVKETAGRDPGFSQPVTKLKANAAHRPSRVNFRCTSPVKCQKNRRSSNGIIL